MIILGLTGSIGMGKTTAAKMFRRCRVPVHDSDAAVHALMGPDGAAVETVESAFPGVRQGDAIDRRALGQRVFDDDAALTRLEAILHPLVREREKRFLAIAARRGERQVVLDIPLLFETGGEARCDAVVVVSAPVRVQRARVLARPGMTEDRLDAILARQVSDREKRRLADFIVPTGRGKLVSLRAIRKIVRMAAALQGRNWPPVPSRAGRAF